MKKYILTMASALALAGALVSCDGYKDKDLDDIVYYCYPAKEVVVAVGENIAIEKGDWVSDNINVATVNGLQATAVGMGTATLTNMDSNPRKLVFVTVPYEVVYYVGDSWNLEGGEWDNTADTVVGIDGTTATALAPGTATLTNTSAQPKIIYNVTVKPDSERPTEE